MKLRKLRKLQALPKCGCGGSHQVAKLIGFDNLKTVYKGKGSE